ncbi:MAG: D-lyxose/D-mannose family sugar isomerase [Lachnospiraceae bacterium]|nr:D-lyxose/D-mannose family sugar isomerase [Lachnospiraceae bacterium]
MKRSEINAVIKKFEKLMDDCCFKLPPYLSFTKDEWAEKSHEYDEIRDCELGWDVTDYGEGHFDTLGLALITIRNGKLGDSQYAKPYAEKIMMCDSGQVSPMHYHENKVEDIINRGGNDIIFTFYNADRTRVHRQEDGREIFEKDLVNDVLIYKDGRHYKVKAGEPVRIHNGESITLVPYQYHEFIIPEGGPSLIGEVSAVNDDHTDNYFYEPLGRFPTIEEDEPAYRVLCTEYPKAKD